ncbi:hypothetical protein M0R45_028629 [Rubus argutus]|uniref:ABC transporter domain-containing protein n=1 Tax=Rubus argutus TaxID=59490 RepID=A0AAW1W880_RUBAR
MAQMVGRDDIESLRIELEEMGSSFRSSVQSRNSSFRGTSALSAAKDDPDAQYAVQWAAIERLPTFERLKSSLFDKDDDENELDGEGKQVVDVTKLGAMEKHLFIDKLIKHIENDNLRLLRKIRNRIDKVGVKLPTVEVRYKNLCVEAVCEVVHGKPLPTLWNSVKSSLSLFTKLPGSKTREAKISIINDFCGTIKPGRLTLLLGPPGCGKTSFLKALSGNLEKSLKISGEVTYNGHKLEEFVPQKTSAYISQFDLHIPEMTVREILDFSARCQGIGSRADIMLEVSKREKEAGIIPHPDIDTYMKAISVQGLKRTLQTDYILKILGLDICADTLVGDAMRRGISGGQKKRLTTAEMIIGPTKALLMDEITNGLDSSTAFQIVACLQQLVISKKDQAQYWNRTEPHNYVSVDMLSKKFKASSFGKKLDEDHFKPFDKFQDDNNALSFSVYSLSKWELFRACSSREILLMKRNSFIYVFKTVQLIIIAFITMTVFLRTRMDIDVLHANYYMGSLFFALTILLVDGIPEMSMTIQRLEVFYKQRDLYFYPAWAYAVPATLLKVPVSFVEALVWTSLTYYVIGYSPEFHRFIFQFFLLFAVHLTSISMFRFLASFFQTMVATMTAGSFAILFLLLFSGFIIKKPSMPGWLGWGFWASPLTYGEIGLSVNEFHSSRWQTMLSTNITVGRETLESRGLNFDGYFYWISLGALFGFTIIFNIGYTLSLSFLKSPGSSRGIISHEKLSLNAAHLEDKSRIHSPKTTAGRMVLPFTPLSLVFQDVQYYVIPMIDSKTKAEFVNEVLETIELDGIKDALVGIPGVSGLSTEQRKRLTIAVELVSNPSIIFMDEPTTGLDARAAAIVMRAVKNVADTGRTIVCTIHQPNIEIFEAFDELILLKTGGHIIYSGPVGQHSNKVIEYFQRIPGVQKIKNNYNPATWMLDITSTSAEAELGVDFSQIYKESSLYEANIELARQFSTPPPGSSDLHFATRFSQNGWMQFKSCLWKQHLSYWRSPAYNLMRIMHTLVSSLIFGTLFWNQGKKITDQQSLFNILGSMYAGVIFLGINNCATVLQYVATERTVMYREKFVGMYSPWAFSLAQVAVEVPYIFIQAVLFLIITYPMIGYYASAYKVFWYLYAVFCSLLYYNYMGMMLVSLTPNFMVAAILSSVFYTLYNLFSGFLIPKPQIPKWWIWLYYLTPSSWSLHGLLTSQYGDINKEIIIFGQPKTVSAFLKDYFGFHHDQLAMVALVLIAFPIAFASIFAYGIGRLNFQRR